MNCLGGLAVIGTSSGFYGGDRRLGNKRNRLVSLFGSLRVQPCANVSGCWLDLVGCGNLNPT